MKKSPILKNKVLSRTITVFLFVLLSLPLIELYYIDFLFADQPFLFALKYMHIPSFVIACFIISVNSYVEKLEGKPDSPKKRQEFWIVLICAFMLLYFSSSSGMVSMYNRLIGKQEDVVLRVKFLEDVGKVYKYKPNNVSILSEDDKEYSLFYPRVFASEIEEGKTIDLKVKKGSLGFYYKN